jgi:uncharacterized Tic20 family protein
MNEIPPVTTDPLPASQDEKTLAVIMHVLCLVGFPVIGPLVIWLSKKDQSPYIDAQGRELLNFHISYVIYFFVAILSIIVLIGMLLVPVLAIATVIFIILGIVRATEGRIYRFPFTIRFL